MRLEMRFWIADPMNGVNNVRSDVNRAIWRIFRDQGVTIPVAAARGAHARGAAAGPCPSRRQRRTGPRPSPTDRRAGRAARHRAEPRDSRRRAVAVVRARLRPRRPERQQGRHRRPAALRPGRAAACSSRRGQGAAARAGRAAPDRRRARSCSSRATTAPRKPTAATPRSGSRSWCAARSWRPSRARPRAPRARRASGASRARRTSSAPSGCATGPRWDD